MMTQPRVLGPCPTTWSFVGWRAWYDRIFYGHVGHHCNRHEHERGHHCCDCGARLTTVALDFTPPVAPHLDNRRSYGRPVGPSASQAGLCPRCFHTAHHGECLACYCRATSPDSP